MMNAKRWIGIFLSVSFIAIGFVGIVNYVVDPYGLYKTNIINKPKIKQFSKIRLIKAIKTKEIKPSSIVLGSSRTEVGYDPTHKYFIKPSFNLANPGPSMYESMLNFKYALKQGNLKKVLLVTDFLMLNSKKQKAVQEFETYFGFGNGIYSLLFSLDVLKDSILTIKGGVEVDPSIYLENGQNNAKFFWKYILREGGHLEKMNKYDKGYYKGWPTNYTYRDTRKRSFPDFEEIVKLCYENNIELDIIFGPSHIRLWESLNYDLDYDKWLRWKKDIVLSVNKIANQKNKKQFRIMDFSVYHKLTAEKVPTDKNTKMNYHWESSHYKHELGLIVLDRLEGNSGYKDFGVALSLQNIDKHLKQQKINRHKFIDVKKYQMEVFGKVKKQ